MAFCSRLLDPDRWLPAPADRLGHGRLVWFRTVSKKPEPARTTADAEAPGARTALARDRALLERWAKGDSGAGAVLLDHYAGFVRTVALRGGVRSGAEFEEFWQDLVLRVLQHLPTLKSQLRTSFAGWIGWQVRDLLRSWRRRARRIGIAVPDLEIVHHDDAGERTAFWEALQGCAAALPPREQAVFQHRFLGGLDLTEVAEQVQSNANAVAQAVFRLVRRLRDCLSAKGFADPGEAA